MCFSATASFTAGTALSAFGCVTLWNVRRKSDILFTAIPLLFGLQQLTEGMVWISFQMPTLHAVSTFIYSMFSHVLWPTFVPLSLFLMEREPWRRSVLRIFIVIGAVVSLYLLYFLVTESVAAEIVDKSISYVSPHFYVIPMIIFYLAATCISPLFSSHRFINLFGIAVSVFAFITYQFFEHAFISVWCFFAAILSAVIYLHFRYEYKDKQKNHYLFHS